MGSYGEFGQREWASEIPLSSEEIRRERLRTAKKFPFTEAGLKESLANGADPIELSLQKWEILRDIAAAQEPTPNGIGGLMDDIGSHTCALCLHSIAEYRKTTSAEMTSSRDKCGPCALEKIDCCVDKDSVYKRIESLVIAANFGYSGEGEKTAARRMTELCEQMIKNLRRAKNV